MLAGGRGTSQRPYHIVGGGPENALFWHFFFLRRNILAALIFSSNNKLRHILRTTSRLVGLMVGKVRDNRNEARRKKGAREKRITQRSPTRQSVKCRKGLSSRPLPQVWGHSCEQADETEPGTEILRDRSKESAFQNTAQTKHVIVHLNSTCYLAGRLTTVAVPVKHLSRVYQTDGRIYLTNRHVGAAWVDQNTLR